MAKPSLTSFTDVKYRAYCHNCDFKGTWRREVDQARQDARDHLAQNSSHDIDIELNQSFLTPFRPEKED